MTPEEQAANDRIKAIAKQQAALEVRAKRAQELLAETVLEGAEKWLDNPAALASAMNQLAAGPLGALAGYWANDLLAIEASNGEYFKAVAQGLTAKDYAQVSVEARALVLDRFGIKAGGRFVKGGYFDSVINSNSLLLKVKQQAWQAKSRGLGVQQFKKDIKSLIVGKPGAKGVVEKHFDTFAYDTYQASDAAVQDFYAQRLELPAALYLGGEIRGTRSFCLARNGKVFLRAEIEAFRDLDFDGKTSPYDPFIDRGGYRCRHHWHWITAKQAARRDSSLKINENGTLIREKSV